MGLITINEDDILDNTLRVDFFLISSKENYIKTDKVN